MAMSTITKEQYDTLAEAFDEAEDSVVPFPIVNGDELIVAGDANETEITKHDFKIRFTVPVVDEETGQVKYTHAEKEYKNIFILPRHRARIVQHIVGIRPFFDKIQENGEVTAMSAEERAMVFSNMDEELLDHLYDLTALVLRIDPALKDYMEPVDVIVASTNIILAYKDLANEADAFFDKSPVKQ